MWIAQTLFVLFFASTLFLRADAITVFILRDDGANTSSASPTVTVDVSPDSISDPLADGNVCRSDAVPEDSEMEPALTLSQVVSDDVTAANVILADAGVRFSPCDTTEVAEDNESDPDVAGIVSVSDDDAGVRLSAADAGNTVPLAPMVDVAPVIVSAPLAGAMDVVSDAVCPEISRADASGASPPPSVEVEPVSDSAADEGYTVS